MLKDGVVPEMATVVVFVNATCAGKLRRSGWYVPALLKVIDQV